MGGLDYIGGRTVQGSKFRVQNTRDITPILVPWQIVINTYVGSDAQYRSAWQITLFPMASTSLNSTLPGIIFGGSNHG